VPILTTMKIDGDPDELLRLKQEHLDPVTEDIAKQNGGIQHLVGKTDDGILIVNLWEHEEGMEKTAAEIRPRAQEAGLPQPSEWRQYELAQRVDG
jgi:hypothetical protein